MKITVIIVIFNKEISQSNTLKNIKTYAGLDVLIIDNSTQKTGNKIYCDKNKFRYLSMDGNKGLSKAYNTALDLLTDTDVIVLLDDDTDVPSAYFDTLKRELEEKPDVDIFVPIIRGQNGIIYSPNNYNFMKNKLVGNPLDEVRQDSFNAISSCMAIRMRVFEDYRYNEKLFVDEIDHCFCREQREKKRKFEVINIEIKQNFHQRGEHVEPEFAWNRVRIRIIDIFRHARIMGGGKYIILAFVKCCGIGAQIGKKSKSIGVTGKAFALSCNLVFTEE